MSWFKVDDGFLTHPKVYGIKSGPLALWLRAGCWCAGELTDGHIPKRALRGLEAKPAHIQELVDRGLWETAEDGFQFHDWLDFQPSREQVLKTRNETLQRVRRHRNAVTNAPVTPAPVPVPVPVPVPENNQERETRTRAKILERAPIGAPPPELPPSEPPLAQLILSAHSAEYVRRMAGAVPMADHKAATKVAQWCEANAGAYKLSGLELGLKVVAGLFASPRASQSRWKLSWAANDAAEYAGNPPGVVIEPVSMLSPKDELKEARDRWGAAQREVNRLIDLPWFDKEEAWYAPKLKEAQAKASEEHARWMLVQRGQKLKAVAS